MPIALVVDDDPSIRELFSLALEVDGWTVLTAEDGIEALEVLAAHHPDVVTLDMMMPRMTGMDVLREMADNPALAVIPRIVVSAADEPAQRQMAEELGAVAWLNKPVSIDRFLAAVLDHLSDPSVTNATSV